MKFLQVSEVHRRPVRRVCLSTGLYEERRSRAIWTEIPRVLCPEFSEHRWRGLSPFTPAP
jgi:hypothetical protein